MPERESARPPYLAELPNPWLPLPDYLPVDEPPTEPDQSLPLVVTAGGGADEPVIPQEKGSTNVGAGTQEQVPEAERQRVTLAGRVGAAPTFRQSPKTKQTIARYPLAVHPDPDTTEWKTILAFGKRAEQLRDEAKLAKSEQIQVIGYVHTRDVMDRNGAKQQVEEVYATSIHRA